MTSQTVAIKNIELFAQFAQAFNKLCADAELPMKTKLAVSKLRAPLMEQAKKVEEVKNELKAKGEAITDDDNKAFQELMMESHNYQFDKLDVTMIAKNLSVIELEALSPIIK